MIEFLLDKYSKEKKEINIKFFNKCVNFGGKILHENSKDQFSDYHIFYSFLTTTYGVLMKKSYFQGLSQIIILVNNNKQ